MESSRSGRGKYNFINKSFRTKSDFYDIFNAIYDCIVDSLHEDENLSSRNTIPLVRFTSSPHYKNDEVGDNLNLFTFLFSL